MSAVTLFSRHGITISGDWIATFCRRWKIRELAVFGSLLRDDFRDDSDIDVLIDPLPNVHLTFDDLAAMQDEMTKALQRKVEIVERGGVERSPNYIRRRHILATSEPIYVEG